MRRFTTLQAAILLALGSHASDGAVRAPLTPEDSLVATPSLFTTDESAQGRTASDWSALQDAALDSLIAQALTANTDVRAALARVRMADAGRAGARAMHLPQGTIDVSRQSGEPVPADYSGALGVEWELDLFDRLGAAERDAAARLRASLAEADAVRHLVASRVARTWFALLGARQVHALHARQEASQKEITALTATMAELGTMAEGDVARSRAEAASLRGDALAARDAVVELQARLAILLGHAPGQWTAPDGPTASEPTLVALRIPDFAQILARRPDVQQAAAALAASGADAQAHAAARWPRLTLFGVLGFLSGDLGRLFLGGADSRGQGATLQWNLFSMPRLQAEYRRADAAMDVALAQYDGVVLQAIHEVEVALHRQASAFEQLQARVAAASESRRAADAALARYEEGAAPYLEPLVAERDALRAEVAAVEAHVQQRVALVDVHRALGIAPR